MTTTLSGTQRKLAREILGQTVRFQDRILEDYPMLNKALASAIHTHFFAIEMLCGAEADQLTDHLRDFLKRNTCACCGKREAPDRC